MLVADSEPLTAGEFASMLSRAMGKQLRTLRIPASALRAALSVAGRGSDSRRLLGAFVLDPSLAKARLGWTPAHSCWDELSWSELQLRTGSGEWA